MDSHAKLAQHIINNGRPFTEHLTEQGTAETGPYTQSYYGYRWGRARVTLCPNGNIWLELGNLQYHEFYGRMPNIHDITPRRYLSAMRPIREHEARVAIQAQLYALKSPTGWTVHTGPFLNPLQEAS